MSLSLLVVDDNLSLANLYQIVFERSGWQVRRVTDGREAIDIVTTEALDVVLLDVMMPGLDGVEVCRQIRSKRPIPPPYIVIYTANNRPEVRDASLAAGADLFYSKNMPIFELPELVIAQLSPPASE